MPKLQEKNLSRSKLKQARIIGGALAVKAKPNHSVMAHTVAQHFLQFNTRPQKQQLSGSAPANKRRMHRCVTAVIQSYKITRLAEA